MNDKNFDMSSIDDIVINSGNVDKNANLKKGRGHNAREELQPAS
ncbi:hypothetical protein [uncultured Campylobacter sp.]|nr:hypothetical protein [uncultured Campylobacter sp.]